MARCPIHVGASAEHGATPKQGCRASRARPYDCVVAEAGQTGAQRSLDERVAVMAVRASEAPPICENDEHLWSGNVGV
jgi:hypothetical protein